MPPTVDNVIPLVGVGAHDDPRMIKCCKITIDRETGGHKPLPYGGLRDFVVELPIVSNTTGSVFVIRIKTVKTCRKAFVDAVFRTFDEKNCLSIFSATDLKCTKNNTRYCGICQLTNIPPDAILYLHHLLTKG